MDPQERMRTHHDELVGTVKALIQRTDRDPADASLLLSYCNEYLVPHAEAEEATLYAADDDASFINRMIREHKEIKHSLDEIDVSFCKSKSEIVRTEASKFMALIDEHFDEEERMLIPRISSKMTEEQLNSLIDETHRIESERKKADVWSLFEYDHRRIDQNIFRLQNACENGDRISTYYTKMRAQLLKHIELEETVLFHAFSELATRDQMGPVNVMTAEHGTITSFISIPEGRIDAQSLLRNIAELTAKLAVHNKKEELILYPMINRTLPLDRRVEVFNECYEGLAAV